MTDSEKAIALLDAWAAGDPIVVVEKNTKDALNQQQRERLWKLSGSKKSTRLTAPILR